jgi:hypothetical protein
VATKAVVNTLRAPMTPNTRLKKKVAEIMGNVTWRNLAHAPAPSSSAASDSSTGTPCRPARKISIALPPVLAHRLMIMIDGKAHSLLASHDGPAIPMALRARFAGPISGYRIQLQSSARATAGVSVGT